MERTYSHLDLDERRKIARWRTAGLTVSAIA
ncbi:helix-turn-helix domain-containing protein, partial [Agrobacterium tumefaciens]